MARVILNNETYNAATSNVLILGSNSFEQVNIFQGVSNVEIASSIEQINLPGDTTDYTFSSFGASLSIHDDAGNIIATVQDSGGKQIGFGDGVLDVFYDPSNFELRLGDNVIPGYDLGTGTPATPEHLPIRDFGWLDDNTYLSGGDTPFGYNIQINFRGDWDQDVAQIAANAAEKISDIVVGDLPEYYGFDDLVINADLEEIDYYIGFGRYYGPFLRPDSFIP